MKFKVLKGTETFNKMAELQVRAKAAQLSAKELIDSIIEPGDKNTEYYAGREFAGGITAIRFSKQPENWGKTKWDPSAFYPLKRKVNAEIRDRIANLPIITFEEFNEVLGFKTQFTDHRFYKHPGYTPKEDYFLLNIANDCKFTPNKDMVEILESEYIKLKAEK